MLIDSKGKWVSNLFSVNNEKFEVVCSKISEEDMSLPVFKQKALDSLDTIRSLDTKKEFTRRRSDWKSIFYEKNVIIL